MFKNWIDDTWEKFNENSYNKKVIIWGFGKRCLEQLPLWNLSYNISYIVDSDENKWKSIYCGKEVFSPNKILNEALGSYVVLICGQYTGEIAQRLEEMGIIEYYSEYWMNNLQLTTIFRYQNDIPGKEIENVCEILEDEQSKKILNTIVEKRAMGICDYTDIVTDDEYFRDDIFEWKSGEIYIDAGAYDGDSIIQFVKKNPDFKKIYAFEADKKNYDNLKRSYIYQAFKEKINIFNQGIWDKYEIVKFYENMGVSSSAVCEAKFDKNDGTIKNAKIKSVEFVSLDKAIIEPITFIKMDIEGSEMRALKGAKQIITTYKPKLAICIYHKLDDLWRIPQYIHSLVPEYKFYIRHHSILYSDTVLYATL